MAAKVKRCARCDRRLRNSGDGWAVAIDDRDDHGFGVVAEFLCPQCTTDDEHTQREINDATCVYRWRGDRVGLWPKPPAAALN